MITRREMQTLEEMITLSLSLREVLLKVIKEADSPGQMPCWRKAHNNYEDPCIGSAFEKTGRRYTALYMGGYFIDLDDLFNKLPKEDSK